MPHLKTYDLFISHAWRYDDDYRRLVKLLRDASLFKWRNYSVPQQKRINANSDYQLSKALERQIRPANAVLIISGMYFNYREWIQREMEIAQNYDKPMIGIRPRGAKRTPAAVRGTVHTMAGWSTGSIVQAIRKYAL